MQDSETVEPTFDGFSGDWEATLTVPADTTDFGEWTVEAVCRLEFPEDAAVAPAGIQFLIDYIPRAFTVTEPAQEPPPPVEEPPPPPRRSTRCRTSRAEPGVRPRVGEGGRRLDGIGHVETDPLTGLVARDRQELGQGQRVPVQGLHLPRVMSSCV